MKADSTKKFQSTIEYLVSAFADFANELQIPEYLTEDPYFVPHYYSKENGASLVLDRGTLCNTYKIAREFGIHIMTSGIAENAISSLDSKIDSKYRSLDSFTKVIAGFFRQVIDGTNPRNIDRYRVQRYLPLLVQQLTTERFLEISKSLIYPFRSDVETIELDSGIIIRRLYPDEYDNEWNRSSGDAWFRGEDKGPSTDYVFENVYPQKTIDEVFSQTSGVFVNHPLRLIQMLRILGYSGVGYSRLVSGHMFYLDALHTSSPSPDFEYLYSPNPPICLIPGNRIKALEEFWIRFKDHRLDYLDNACRIYTKAISVTDSEVKFLLLMVVADSLLEMPKRELKRNLYKRWEKLHEIKSSDRENSRRFIKQVREARNNLVHEGEIGRAISGRDSLRTPRPDLMRGLVVSISNLLKVAIGFGPVEQERFLSGIDNSNRREIIDSLPRWSTETATNQDK